MEKIQKAGAGFQSLTEAIDTTLPVGRMLMQIVGAFSEFERAMLRERTRNGLDSARKQGRIGGRSKTKRTSKRGNHSIDHFWPEISSRCSQTTSRP